MSKKIYYNNSITPNSILLNKTFRGKRYQHLKKLRMIQFKRRFRRAFKISAYEPLPSGGMYNCH